jgi:soluble lytic murein transglycosylase-like protein
VEDAPGEFPSTLGARRAVWQAIQPLAIERKIDPQFVYAIVRQESDFNPRAKHGENRGLLQIKPREWRAISRLPYETAVWDWRLNLTVGLEIMARMKQALAAKGVFSYPLLWASYHYGYDYVAARGFDIGRIPRPSDLTSYKLWSGEIHPVAPPR